MSLEVDYTDRPRMTATHEGEHHGDENAAPVEITRSARIFVLCAALNSCNLGYDIGVSTTAGKLVAESWNLTQMQRELFIGSINFWASKFVVILLQIIINVIIS